MSYQILSRHSYSFSDQQRFAELSGDWNPLHLDPIQARRELFGDVVVHGLHGVLSALDHYLAALRQRGIPAFALKKMKGLFRGYIYLDQAVEICLVDEHDNWGKLQIKGAEQILTDVEVHWNPGVDHALPSLAVDKLLLDEPQDFPLMLTFPELQSRQGALRLFINPALAAAMFPNLTSLIPPSLLAELLSLSRLVGMECPGLRSLFSSFEIESQLPAHSQTDAVLTYKVVQTDSRFSLVKLQISGPSVVGSINAFVRPSPQNQLGMQIVQQQVDQREFIDQHALIIGGSRGLGEVTAKIIAAGGGSPIITYQQGAADAERVANEITATGGVCRTLHCDVSNPTAFAETLSQEAIAPSQVYYFASPKIFVQKGGVYSPQLFQQFTRVYVDGFFDLYLACRALQAGHFSMFYPSSVAVDEVVKGLAEYAAAKAAGEALCHYLVSFDQQLSILVKRLPRIATDQTMTLFAHPASGAFEVMIEVVRAMSANTSASA